ncbi:hypothetical protein [Oceanobacillus salinisoli]|uniref:hypothetical protein n=1 Tax=Oceanobacillus salinisoli TaxID=2678611 RepID=UPI0012E165AC|nr:hypothetical protein [Oceanobacillus salinisoli]
MKKMSKIFGVIGGISGIILWSILVYINPYSDSVGANSNIGLFFMLFLPACLAIIASFITSSILLFISFLWSLPYSLYLSLTPGIFALFGLVCLTYLLSFVILLITERKKMVRQ